MKTIQRTADGASEIEEMARNLKSYEKENSAWQIICSADNNAALTCREQKISAKDDNYFEKWSEYFWGSLETLLSNPSTIKAHAFFRRRGVKW